MQWILGIWKTKWRVKMHVRALGLSRGHRRVTWLATTKWSKNNLKRNFLGMRPMWRINSLFSSCSRVCHGRYIDSTTETRRVPDLKSLSLSKNQINEHREWRRSVIRLDGCCCVTGRFYTRGQQPCKFIGTKGRVYIGQESNSHRIGLVQQHGRRLIHSLEYQYDCRYVMWKRIIKVLQNYNPPSMNVSSFDFAHFQINAASMDF